MVSAQAAGRRDESMDGRKAERIVESLGYFMRAFHIIRNRSESAGILPPPMGPQYLALALIRDGPVSMGSLSRRMGCSKPNVTALVSRLMKDGLARKFHGDDRRVAMIAITPKGRKSIMDRRRAAVRAIRASLDALSGEEADELALSLDKANRIISRLERDGDG